MRLMACVMLILNFALRKTLQYKPIFGGGGKGGCPGSHSFRCADSEDGGEHSVFSCENRSLSVLF